MQVTRDVAVGGWSVVGRELGIKLVVVDRDLQAVAESLQVFECQFLHLVCGVAALEVRAQRPPLDGLGQDDRWLAPVLHRGLIRREELAVVVSASLQRPDLLVGQSSTSLRVRGSRPKKCSRTNAPFSDL